MKLCFYVKSGAVGAREELMLVSDWIAVERREAKAKVKAEVREAGELGCDERAGR